MPTSIHVPRVGMTMTEVTLLEWTVPDRSLVTVGDPIYIMETDKVEVDGEAPASGVLFQRAAPGAVYAVGDVLGEIEDA